MPRKRRRRIAGGKLEDDVLSQARGLGLGMTLANQYFGQLPEAIKAAVLGTVRTTVAFAVDQDDAKLLEKRYAPLTADDLAGLSRYEVAARCCVDGQTLSPVTLSTLPPDPLLRDPAELEANATVGGAVWLTSDISTMMTADEYSRDPDV